MPASVPLNVLGRASAQAGETDDVGVFIAVRLVEGVSVGVIDGSAPADGEVENDEVGVGALEAECVRGV